MANAIPRWHPGWLTGRRGRRLAVAVLACQLLVVAIFAVVYRPFDLRIYLWGGRAVWHGPMLYHVLVAGNWYTYPPFSALVFSPLAVLPAWLVGLAWELGSVAALAWTCRALLRLAGHQPSSAQLAALTAAALLLEPMYHTLYLGQVNIFLTALVVADLGRAAKGRPAGVLIGLAAAVKLIPALFALLLVATGRWRDAGRAAATFAVCTAAGWLADPAASQLYWSRLFRDTSRVSAVYISNQTPYALLARLAGGTSHVGAWWLMIALLLASAGLTAAAIQARHGDWLAATATAGITSLLASPISWTHHWTWALPALLVLALRPGRARLAVVGGSWLLFVVAPMWFTPWHGATAQFGWHGLDTLLANSFLLAGLAYLAWTTTAALRQSLTLRAKRLRTPAALADASVS